MGHVFRHIELLMFDYIPIEYIYIKPSCVFVSETTYLVLGYVYAVAYCPISYDYA